MQISWAVTNGDLKKSPRNAIFKIWLYFEFLQKDLLGQKISGRDKLRLNKIAKKCDFFLKPPSVN